jgi:CRP/FNR family transcriptional regulator, dissimilatory nitrate respiration regulator
MTPHPMTAATRPPAQPWHAAAGTGPAPDPAPLRRLQAAFPSCWLHRDTAQALLDAVRVHTLAPGPLTLSPRDQPPAWWLVADGRIVAGDTGAQGALVESRVVEAGQWFDVVSGWTAADWTERAVCATPVTLWALPLDRLLACARGDETLQRAMGCVMADRVRQLAVDRHALATKDVTARVASWLLRQLPVAADDSTAITLREQKRSIARQLVMAQETLSRCFRRLVDLGCIDIKGYVVTVRDLRALQSLAASPAA